MPKAIPRRKQIRKSRLSIIGSLWASPLTGSIRWSVHARLMIGLAVSLMPAS
jgi:hypothetical protein